jgi:hypothetical protein
MGFVMHAAATMGSGMDSGWVQVGASSPCSGRGGVPRSPSRAGESARPVGGHRRAEAGSLRWKGYVQTVGTGWAQGLPPERFCSISLRGGVECPTGAATGSLRRLRQQGIGSAKALALHWQVPHVCSYQ